MSEQKTERFDPVIACRCGWIGKTSKLVNAEGCHYCPACGEFFMPLPGGWFL